MGGSFLRGGGEVEGYVGDSGPEDCFPALGFVGLEVGAGGAEDAEGCEEDGDDAVRSIDYTLFGRRRSSNEGLDFGVESAHLAI